MPSFYEKGRTLFHKRMRAIAKAEQRLCFGGFTKKKRDCVKNNLTQSLLGLRYNWSNAAVCSYDAPEELSMILLK